MKTTVPVACTLLAVLAQAAVFAEPALKPKQLTTADLRGTYELVSGEKNGQPIRAERIQGSRVTITDRSIAGTDKEKKQTFAADYQLDVTGKVPVINMVSTTEPNKGVKAIGLVTRLGDQVQLIYALPGGSPPTEFKTHDGQLMVTLQAVKVPAATP